MLRPLHRETQQSLQLALLLPRQATKHRRFGKLMLGGNLKTQLGQLKEELGSLGQLMTEIRQETRSVIELVCSCADLVW